MAARPPPHSSAVARGVSANRPNPMTSPVTAVAAVPSSPHPATLARDAECPSTTVAPPSSQIHGSMMNSASP